MFGFLKRRRRERLLATPLPPAWTAVLQDNVAHYRRLPPEARRRLEGLVQVFLAEKRFEGCGGFALTDEARLIVAGQACVLLLEREHDFYPLLDSILIYPAGFVTNEEMEEVEGIVGVDDGERTGESWSQGAMVLSWEDIALDIREPEDGWNVVYHEFAHQLGDESGADDGVPVLPDPERQRAWAEVLGREYEALARAFARGRRTFFDDYGADSPTEFFAVATEHFFEQPAQLKIKHPDLYEQLRLFYGQDPVTLPRDPRARR